MKPVHLTMRGFLSYRDETKLDFDLFDLACISGNNGAGKSSILDAITFSLFGKARKNDAALIHTACDKAELIFVFDYESQRYRIHRVLHRNKSFVLEFQQFNGTDYTTITESNRTRTETLIQQKLGFDYETFTNASFFLQGDADSFTQKKPNERKEILGKILGLGRWDDYKQRTVKVRQVAESELKVIEQQILIDEKKIASAPLVAQKLAEATALANELTHNLALATEQLQMAAQIVQQHHQDKLALSQSNQKFSNSIRDHEAARSAAERTIKEILSYEGILASEEQLQSEYDSYQRNQQQFDTLTPFAGQFRTLSQNIQELDAIISREKTILEAQVENLLNRQIQFGQDQLTVVELNRQWDLTQQQVAEVETQISALGPLEETENALRTLTSLAQQYADLNSELKLAKNGLTAQIDSLRQEQVGIEQKKQSLQSSNSQFALAAAEQSSLLAEINTARQSAILVNQLTIQIATIQSNLSQLSAQREETVQRQIQLRDHDSAHCHLCEQALSPQDHAKLLAKLAKEEHSTLLNEQKLKESLEDLHNKLQLHQAEASREQVLQNKLHDVNNRLAELSTKQKLFDSDIADWENVRSSLLEELVSQLESKSYHAPFLPQFKQLKDEMQPHLATLGLEATDNADLRDKLTVKSRQIADTHKKNDSLRIQLNELGKSSASIQERKKMIDENILAWQSTEQPLLVQLQHKINTKDFNLAERQAIQNLQADLRLMDFDPILYEQLANQLSSSADVQKRYQELQAAKSALPSLQQLHQSRLDEQSRLEADKNLLAEEIKNLEAKIAATEASLPNINLLENEITKLKRELTDSQKEIGAGEQELRNIEDAKHKVSERQKERSKTATDIDYLKALETAFGKTGVPTMLIEQAVPSIEDKANTYLDKLSNGTMSIRIETQESYADKKRADLKETLDIIIYDSHGPRDYEMYSGGEAFRVNFAIRLALSEVLASRANAKLSTLVIDEGFGSQDADGREKLKQCINAIRGDFEKILVITHLDDLKEAFPNRIDIEKMDGSSRLSVN